MKLVAVVAASENNVIGRDNALPWHLPADLARFKSLTLDRPVLMGRRTWESLGKPLARRRNLVLSRTAREFRGADRVASLEDGCSLVADCAELMIIGGAALYQLALPHVHRIYLTRVHCRLEGDALFPALARSGWREMAREHRPADERNAYAMTFIELQRAGRP